MTQYKHNSPGRDHATPAAGDAPAQVTKVDHLDSNDAASITGHSHVHGGSYVHKHDHGHDHHNDHGHGHDHNHDHHSHIPKSMRALIIVLSFTTVVFLAELIGGLLSGSLALLSDAMHMLSDSTGLLVALAAMIIARRESKDEATYGNKRFEVLAALLNAVAVSVISVWIVLEAISRISNHAEINARTTLIIGIIGLIANLFAAFVLSGHSNENMNLRGAYLHVLVDLFGSVAVIAAATIMLTTGWYGADTVASLLIAALILPRSLRLAWDAITVLLERAPRGIDINELQMQLEAVPGVLTVHDLHVWSLDGQRPLATCHVVTNINSANCQQLDQVQEVMARFGIHHNTIQVEFPDHFQHEEICEPSEMRVEPEQSTLQSISSTHDHKH
ncbi:MAG: cation diffusion facilitator family transporter [Corynebacterium sp.]|nr:cation diffusion facilitator family transporter [Corynebacterium sp.]